jgi:hypothetical protein
MNEGWACLHPDSLVFTAAGVVTMRELVEGASDTVFDGEAPRRVYDQNVIRDHETVTMRTRRGIELCLRHHFLAEEPALLVARTIGTGAPAIECEGHLARTARRGQHPSGGVDEEHDARGTRRTDIALGKTGQRSVVPYQQREFGGTGQIGGFTLTARLELGLRAIQTAGREPDAEGQRRCEGG